MDSYKEYSGSVTVTGLIEDYKRFHRDVRSYYINSYAKQGGTALDVGSGRGFYAKDWISKGVRTVVGIEPSLDSIKIAIKVYSKHRYDKTKTRLMYLHGTGEQPWSTGAAALNNLDKERFIDIFSRRRFIADTVTFFWTFHYMIGSEESFTNLMNNLKKHTKAGSVIVITTVDGEKLHGLMQNSAGVYELRTDNGELIYRTEAKYNTNNQISQLSPFGNKAKVTMPSVYGLEKGVDEYMVFDSKIRTLFKKYGFTMIKKDLFTELNIDSKTSLKPYEKQLAELYTGLIFIKD